MLNAGNTDSVARIPHRDLEGFPATSTSTFFVMIPTGSLMPPSVAKTMGDGRLASHWLEYQKVCLRGLLGT
jgi:hypothetical protein